MCARARPHAPVWVRTTFVVCVSGECGGACEITAVGAEGVSAAAAVEGMAIVGGVRPLAHAVGAER